MCFRKWNARNTAFVLVIMLLLTSLPGRAYGQNADSVKIVFVAGGPSHDFGSHEHYAGSRLLADALRSIPGVECEIVRNGWPADESVFEGADSVVIYSDGGGGHPANAHLETLGKLMDRKVGLVCIHYAVEVPKGDVGDKFLQWLGGYFETHWSVNPHWKAEYPKMVEHPITRGVAPFAAQDEWYYHMRFRPNMDGVTPILSALPPADTLNRPDGAHSGNPDVRKAVANGESQHLAWAYQRPNGGRSFGYTGGHFHWNWGRPEIRRLVANAILWTATGSVPEGGVPTSPLGVPKLIENQDEQVPSNLPVDALRNQFQLISAASRSTGSAAQKEGRKLFESPVLRAASHPEPLAFDVDVRGVKKLYLSVGDGGDGFSCDWADWVDPVLVAGDRKISLLELPWKNASTQWGQVGKSVNAGGQPMRTASGKPLAKGIGTHAISLLEFELPGGFDRFQGAVAIDFGGASQNGGQTSSLQFAVYADAPPASQPVDSNLLRDPEFATAGLDVFDGLEVTLAASEPELKSLTNLDIDYRGRVWVCEVVNYRGHNGERPEGDRILILEDTDQDGVMDQSKVYYQGPEVDSAMGICILGNQVIVSAAPNVWVFTDTDGDDKPDKKEAVFTKTGQPQHDHSNHSFVFGPDGKLYWNFGNTGRAMHDAAGNPVKDRWGRPINDSGSPYRQGMVFRCNLDFSDMEVLGHNFRNNYEVAVDSLGTLWQSDNDDDGNRATRINYVMEFGNFGYVDEMTGEGWQAERIGWESEVPQRHWHLNDPGVVPTMLITGAGSPTGITVYEGRLLPKVFWDQVIHCDAGPNVVRAYPVEPQGAGYQASMVPLLTGSRDRWFRPADVCVAPDGSLYVTDWYDPGVGGHAMQDMARGRLFRIAPPGTAYHVPKFDWSTAEGAVAALASPTQEVRYRAWMAIVAMGDQAVPALKKMAEGDEGRARARAWWLLGKLPGQGEATVKAAMKHQDPEVRTIGIRLARQLKLPTSTWMPSLLKDSQPSIRRELAIALHEDSSDEMPGYWADLAEELDPSDRWSLEALGIGASQRWAECLDTWMTKYPDAWNSEAGKRILWRARAPKAAELLVRSLTSAKWSADQRDALLRSFDFQDPKERDAAWQAIATEVCTQPADRRDVELAVYAATKLGPDAAAKVPGLKDLVSERLRSSSDPKEAVRLGRKLGLKGFGELFMAMAEKSGVNSEGISATDLALEDGQADAIAQALLATPESPKALLWTRLLAQSNRPEARKLLSEWLVNPASPTQARIDAAEGLARTPDGQRQLLKLAQENRLPAEAKVMVSATMRQSKDESVRKESEQLFPAKKVSGAALPPIAQLASRQGNPEQGKKVFDSSGTCAQCHQVQGGGKNVGPDLSEIGTKLSREAFYVSILEPSAGISHNYEAYVALLDDDSVVTGLKINETGDEVILRDAKGIDRKLAKKEIEEIKKSDKSLMPDNLHEALSEGDLVDLVAYLETLKKK
jgi:putative membrane-bound dehydrogenase-like protein